MLCPKRFGLFILVAKFCPSVKTSAGVKLKAKSMTPFEYEKRILYLDDEN